MDYEKAYKDLIKRIKDALSDQEVSDADFGVVIGQIAPELAQSEDERIRQALIRFFKNTNDWVNLEYDGDEIVVYLEKQKDEAQRQFTLGMQAGREEVMYEMEKEQKPVDDIPEYAKEQLKDAGYVIMPTTKYNELVKPAEWSEEDERHILVILEQLEAYQSDKTLRNPLQKHINWLKSLRPQSHWKPSEQEKGALRTAIHILTDERSFPKAAVQLQNILNAFEGKESRKDWKPTEEQMEALRKAFIGYTSRDLSITLKSLYEQLKQL